MSRSFCKTRSRGES